MNFWSEICYLYMNSLKFFHFRWNGQQTKRYFISDSGYVFAVNTAIDIIIGENKLAKNLICQNNITIHLKCLLYGTV